MERAAIPLPSGLYTDSWRGTTHIARESLRFPVTGMTADRRRLPKLGVSIAVFLISAEVGVTLGSHGLFCYRVEPRSAGRVPSAFR